MPRASVEDVLREIESLSEEDRLALDERLAERLREEWERQAQAARDEAQRRGIDQTAIDRTIERRRYGK